MQHLDKTPGEHNLSRTLEHINYELKCVYYTQFKEKQENCSRSRHLKVNEWDISLTKNY